MLTIFNRASQRLVLNVWRASVKIGKPWVAQPSSSSSPLSLISSSRLFSARPTVKEGGSPLGFHSMVLSLAAIPTAATNNTKSVLPGNPDAGAPDAGSHDAGAKNDSGKSAASPADFIVSKGQLTFDAEGGEAPGTVIHSRVPHVPDNKSGVTIGRGYDLKQKKESDVRDALTGIGLPAEQVAAYVNGIGKIGDDAKEYIKNSKDALGEISPKQQKQLFEKMYDFLERDAERLATKKDVVEKYGATNWDALDQKIKDIVVDLHYQGLYAGAQRELIQDSIVKNDLKAFTDILSDRKKWSMVSDLRFKQRVEYLTGKPMEDTKDKTPKNKKKP